MSVRLIQDILTRQAAQDPGKVALVCDGRRITYGELNEMADRLAAGLQALGLRRGDRVILFLPNCPELIVSVFGVLKANAVFTVIAPDTRAERIEYIVEDSAARGIILRGSQSELARDLLSGHQGLELAILTETEALPRRPHRLLAFDRLLAEYPARPPRQRTIDCDLGYLIYTSGSTGSPKGVMITHRSSLFAIQLDIDFLGLGAEDVVFDALPLSFGYGFHQVLKTLKVGARLILERSFAYPARSLALVESEGVTGFPGVPTMFSVILRMDLSRYDLSRLRYLTNTGAPLPAAHLLRLLDGFPNARFYSMYSITEAFNPLGLDPDQVDRRPTSVGKPLAGTEVWLADEDGAPLPQDGEAVGELVVRGGHVRSGYWNDPEASTVRFRPGPLPGELVCYTGDVFRRDDSGYYYFISRSDEIIKSGGKKVAPREVEGVLYSLEEVVEAAVFGVPDPVLGEEVRAAVVLGRGTRISTEAILEHCRGRLEPYKVPRTIQICTNLPKTTSGKIKRTGLETASA